MATEAVTMPESKAPTDNGPKTEDLSVTPTFMLAKPKERGDTFSSFLNHGHPLRVDATFPKDIHKQTWQQKVSMIVVKILWRIYPLLKLVGFIFEWTLNFLVLNHGPFHILFNLLFFRWSKIVIPQSDADNYLSCVGQLDPRNELYVDTSKKGKAESTRTDELVFPDENVGSRKTADVCVMAAKLAYENEAVVKRVVEQSWNMHFVKFFDCWNDYQHMNNTQAFIAMDKPTDANAIVLAFRGTEGFNAYDWSTDFDFSWVKFPDLGSVHLGFLEALGLATREDPSSFTKLRNRALEAKKHRRRADRMGASSGLAEHIIQNRGKSLAYDDINTQLSTILDENPKAKLFVTGHSLGGALASLYAIWLHYAGNTEIASRIGAVYTFGGPRIGDEDVKNYGNQVLAGKLFRVVYCNDLVPRIPFDNQIMAFKHFGICAYFNSVYDGLTLQEEPNPNFFGVARLITMHLNALWEVFQGLIFITLQHGHEYTETTFSILVRAVGLLLPGVASHSPTNYVNSVRLGPFPLRERIKGDIADISQEIYLMQDNVKDIIVAVYEEFLTVLGLKSPKRKQP
ncbi:hypothetical protein M758_11G020500 [Ceratodon purpureus]|nr:hypothetical protein M758_11G020500 [Ceratodon purpureus]